MESTAQGLLTLDTEYKDIFSITYNIVYLTIPSGYELIHEYYILQEEDVSFNKQNIHIFNNSSVKGIIFLNKNKNGIDVDSNITLKGNSLEFFFVSKKIFCHQFNSAGISKITFCTIPENENFNLTSFIKNTQQYCSGNDKVYIDFHVSPKGIKSNDTPINIFAKVIRLEGKLEVSKKTGGSFILENEVRDDKDLVINAHYIEIVQLITAEAIEINVERLILLHETMLGTNKIQINNISSIEMYNNTQILAKSFIGINTNSDLRFGAYNNSKNIHVLSSKILINCGTTLYIDSVVNLQAKDLYIDTDTIYNYGRLIAYDDLKIKAFNSIYNYGKILVINGHANIQSVDNFHSKENSLVKIVGNLNLFMGNSFYLNPFSALYASNLEIQHIYRGRINSFTIHSADLIITNNANILASIVRVSHNNNRISIIDIGGNLTIDKSDMNIQYPSIINIGGNLNIDKSDMNVHPSTINVRGDTTSIPMNDIPERNLVDIMNDLQLQDSSLISSNFKAKNNITLNYIFNTHIVDPNKIKIKINESTAIRKYHNIFNIDFDYIGDLRSEILYIIAELMLYPIPESRIDYRYYFLNDLECFQKNTAKLYDAIIAKDLWMVNYHNYNSILGVSRNLKWATYINDSETDMATIQRLHQDLALVTPDWGNRDAVTIIKIPQNTYVTFVYGKAKHQISHQNKQIFEGGGVQVRFKDFEPSWVNNTIKLNIITKDNLNPRETIEPYQLVMWFLSMYKKYKSFYA